MSVADIFGIDLGTTNSVVGYVKNGKVEIAVDNNGARTIPSFVAYPPNGRPVCAVGAVARMRMRTNPEGVIYNCKRLIGMNYSDPIVATMKGYSSFKIIDDGHNKPLICVKQGEREIRKYPEEISAVVLQEMQSIVAKFAGRNMRKVVITVPAYFNQYQRQATKDAGKIAGLDVVAVISEPVAAAYAYADQNDISADNKEKIIMIYDLGGGTFDVTIMSVTGTKYKELGLDGDLFLGGSDFDTILMDAMIQKYENDTGEVVPLRQKGRLRFHCEEAKKLLMAVPEVSVPIGGEDIYITIQEMDALLKPLIERSINICDRLMGSLFMTADDIDDIILVGGSTRLKLVHSMLEEHYHKELKESINPDECVAYGAAKYGYFLDHQPEDVPDLVKPIDVSATCPSEIGIEKGIVEVNTPQNEPVPVPMKPIDVSVTCPSDIGIGIGRGIMQVIIPRRTILPYTAQLDLTNSRNYMTKVAISIFQGNHQNVSHCRRLQTVTITGVTPKPAGQNRFGVIFSMNKDGNLNLQVVDRDTGKLVQWDSSETAFSEEDVIRYTQDLADINYRQEEYEKMSRTILALQEKGYEICSSLTDPTKKEELNSYILQLGERNTLTEEDIAEVERVFSSYQCCVCSQFPLRVVCRMSFMINMIRSDD